MRQRGHVGRSGRECVKNFFSLRAVFARRISIGQSLRNCRLIEILRSGQLVPAFPSGSKNQVTALRLACATLETKALTQAAPENIARI